MKKKAKRSTTTTAPEAPRQEPEAALMVLLHFLRGLFDLRRDTDEIGTIDNIKRGIEFSGGNLWSLVFAIFIASVGLNVNSTAVIIGAMLISPLMGPIMGSGLAVGTYDFALLWKSLRNLAVATVVSVLTSAIYFWISPLNEAQSELLARTTPTIYDVLIAVFGGAAGIVAGSRRDKTNAIPGVAIATALMPPLCTAGYGLANGSAKFFFGAFYLYMINCIFICFSTIFFVQVLRFKKVARLDEATRRKVRNYVFAFGIITVIPSIYFAYELVQESIFRQASNRFIKESFVFPNTRVLDTDLVYHRSPRRIEVSLLGEPLNDDTIETLKTRLALYNLDSTDLRINQARVGGPQTRGNFEDVLGELYRKNEDVVRSKEDRIRLLEGELLSYKSKSNLLPEVTREIGFLFPNIESFSFGDLTLSNVTDMEQIKKPTVIVRWKRRPGPADRKKLELFLRSRMGLPELEIVNDSI